MTHLTPLRALTTALGLACTLCAQASPQLALDHGCYNCHGANLRGEAHSLQDTSRKLQRIKDDASAQAAFVTKFRRGEPLERIDAHERLSPEAATALVGWLANGAK